FAEQQLRRLLLRERAEQEGDGGGDQQHRHGAAERAQQQAPHALTPTPSKRCVCRQCVKPVTRSFIACARFQFAIHACGVAPTTASRVAARRVGVYSGESSGVRRTRSSASSKPSGCCSEMFIQPASS